jgi:predicted MFS family arabinose efflux permease
LREKTFPHLAVSSLSANAADQIMLALLPLVLVSAGHSAKTIATVVAAHSAAWLLISLPVGAYADRLSRRTIMLAGACCIMAGACLGLSATYAATAPSLWLLGFAAFGVASGVVMSILAIFAVLPHHVSRERLASANAFLEFGRAVVCIAAPLLAAYLLATGRGYVGFVIALAGGALAFVASSRMPVEKKTSNAGVSILVSIRDGAAFVAREPLLRAIALCALAWNSAFFALTAVFANYAADYLGMSVELIGRAWSMYGAGLLLGSLVASAMIARLPTVVMFWFGPLCSALGIVVMAALAGPGRLWPVYVAFFSLGFGPMTWLVLQTSARQLVTPPALLGRVGATISTAIYGVRPIGALIAGSVAHAFGTHAAIGLAAALFVVSGVVMVLSPAVRLRALPKAQI